MRESRVYVAAIIAVAAFAWYLAMQPAADGPTGPRYVLPTATPVLATATPVPTAAPPLDGQTWVLDFEQSGMSDSVAVCPRCSLGSSLSFSNGHVEGNTGAGGGCDIFTGDYFAGTTGVAQHLFSLSILDTPSKPCYPRRVPEIHRRLAFARAYTLSNCPGTDCELMLLDREGSTLLYRLAQPG